MTNRQKSASRFESQCLAHTLRLVELESQQAHKQSPVFPALSGSRDAEDAQRWLIQRAYESQHSAASLQWIRRWMRTARFSFLIVILLAIVSGASAAIGFFGAEQRSVNVIWTLIGLIGVHGLALLLWLFGGRLAGGWLGRASFWLMSRWGKKAPSNNDLSSKVATALVTVLSRNGLGKWSLNCITHSVWLVALLTSLLTMLVVLSVRSYSFALETTILSETVILEIVQAIAYLPSVLGFAVPSNEMIIAALDASQFNQIDIERRGWVSFLSGALLVYAVIPRLLVLAWSFLRLRHAYSSMQLDVKLPGFAELFATTKNHAQVVDGAPKALRQMLLHKPSFATQEAIALVGLELGPGLDWPPAGVQKIQDLRLFDEVVATGGQQRAVVQVLQARPVRRILIVCDARLSPDRGSLQWLIDVSLHASNIGVCVINPSLEKAQNRQEIWARSLEGIGLGSNCLFYSLDAGLTWLNSNE